ncbi:MAG: hypothetical protein KDA85_15600, partial [Planctomycetaceae bacterium]|nr:hypothetical protein [Planctomycetaceae bacterium]
MSELPEEQSSLPPDETFVDWSLLTHSPIQFFGLQDGFDNRDLKRAYNCLIRRFKPERFPDEFQRIRAAYDRLDNQFRYGKSSTTFSMFPDVSSWDAWTRESSSDQSSS